MMSRHPSVSSFGTSKWLRTKNCSFEVMKLFSSLEAGVAGAVAAILVANESLVEQDQPLILIKPD